MTDENREQIVAELCDRLEAFGLTEYEARTLVALARLGTGTARDIADADGVPRTRVYDAVDTLHEMGLVDIQYTTPRKFTVVSTETLVRKLDLTRKNQINEIQAHLESLDSADPETEQLGAWTVTGRDAVLERVREFIDEAESEIVYLTVDELLTDAHVESIREAEERGVDVYVGGVSATARNRIREAAPAVSPFETLWEWSTTPSGTLIVTDRNAALVSVYVDGDRPEGPREVAIWGRGSRNSLVVVLRAIFTWQLETYEHTPGDRDGETSGTTDGETSGSTDGETPEPTDERGS